MLSVAELVSLIGLVMLAVGLAVTWIRNGRSQGTAMGKMEGSLVTEIKNIKERLDDPVNGLGSIKGAVDNQAVHCARISTGLDLRVSVMERKKRK